MVSFVFIFEINQLDVNLIQEEVDSEVCGYHQIH
jgi:hypothetical protein